jgi:hypothetical protein
MHKLFIVASSVLGANAEAAGDIAPTGLLRVAVAVGPAASAFWATRDPATGKPRGVTVELAKAAAGKLGVPLQLIEYSNSGEIAAASNKDAWDSSFMPVDAERERFVDQGPAYARRDSRLGRSFPRGRQGGRRRASGPRQQRISRRKGGVVSSREANCSTPPAAGENSPE